MVSERPKSDEQGTRTRYYQILEIPWGCAFHCKRRLPSNDAASLKKITIDIVRLQNGAEGNLLRGTGTPHRRVSLKMASTVPH